MNCTDCTEPTAVIDSRPVDNSQGQRRRRLCVHGHRFSTYEFPVDFLDRVVQTQLTARLAFVGSELTLKTYVDGEQLAMSEGNGTTALATREQPTALEKMPDVKPSPLIPRNFDAMLKLADMFSKSALVPKSYMGNAANCFVAIQYGAELGMHALASVRNIDVINGTPSLRARAAAGVCMASHDCEFFREDRERTVRGKLHAWECKRGGQMYYGEFSIEEAEAAKLTGKDTWKSYPAAMLENRAIMYCARQAYPDKLSGVYSDEEARNDVIDVYEQPSGSFAAAPAPVDNAVVESVEVVETEPEPPVDNDAAEAAFVDLVADIHKTTNKPELSKLTAQLKAFAEKFPDYRDAAKAEYKKHRETLK